MLLLLLQLLHVELLLLLLDVVRLLLALLVVLLLLFLLGVTRVDGGVLGLAIVKGLVQVGELGRGVFTILLNLLHRLESKSTSISTLVIVSKCVFDKSLNEVGLLQIYTNRVS